MVRLARTLHFSITHLAAMPLKGDTMSHRNQNDRKNNENKKDQNEPRYRKPKAVKVKQPGSVPDFHPNRQRELARQEVADRTAHNEMVRELNLKLATQELHHPLFVAGTEGSYVIAERLRDDFAEVHSFSVYERKGKLFVQGSDSDGEVYIPHDWLFLQEGKCRFQHGELGYVQKTMRRFILRVLGNEIEAQRAAWQEKQAARTAPVRLATSNGQRVEVETSLEPEGPARMAA